MRTAIVSGVAVFGPAQLAGADTGPLLDEDDEQLEPLRFVPARTELVSASLKRAGFEIAAGAPLLNLSSEQLNERLRVAGEVPDSALLVHYIGHGLISRDGSLLLPGPEWRPGWEGKTCVDVESLIRYYERNQDGPDVLLLLDVCRAGTVIRAQVRNPFDESSRKVWIVGAAGYDSDAFGGHFSLAVAHTLDRLNRGDVDVDPSLEHVPVDLFAGEVQRELDRLCADEGGGMPQKLEMTPRFRAQGSPPKFFPNLRFNSDFVRSARNVRERELRAFLDNLDPAFDPVHYLSRASGDPDHAAVAGRCFFTGRTDQLRALSAWVDGSSEQGGALRVVTGSPGVGKSALIGMLVCAAHPLLAEVATGIVSRVGPDLLPSVTENLVAVHARGLSLNEVIDSIARQLGIPRPATGRWNARDFCFEVVARTNCVVVVDALDEAVEPTAIMAELLVPLIEIQQALGSPVCRLLVGMRPWDQFTPLLKAADAVGSDARVEALVNLDLVPVEQTRRDIADYVHALLSTSPAYRAPEHRDFRSAAARAIAGALTSTNIGGAFLVAGLYVNLLVDTPENQVTAQDVASRVPTSLGEVLELHIRQLGADNAWLRPVLAALGRAKGDGMSRRLLTAAAKAFTTGTAPDEADVAAVLTLVRYYLRSTAGPDGRTVYRFFHQALADHMTAYPMSTLVPAEMAARTVVHRVFEALRDAERASPRRLPDWRNADPYLLRHLLEHAADAGQVDELIADTEYLIHADPRHVVAFLHDAKEPTAQLLAAAYRTSGPRHFAASPDQRRQLLGVDLARWGDPAMGALTLTAPGAPPPEWTCTHATGEGVRFSYLGSLQGHDAPVSDLRVTTSSAQRVVSLSEDGTVRSWNVESLQEEGRADIAAKSAVTTFVEGKEVLLTLNRSEIVLWDLPDLVRRLVLRGDPDRDFTEMYPCPHRCGPYLLTRTIAGVIHIWDLVNGRRLGEIRRPISAHISAVSLGENVLGVRVRGKKPGGELFVWDGARERFIPHAKWMQSDVYRRRDQYAHEFQHRVRRESLLAGDDEFALRTPSGFGDEVEALLPSSTAAYALTSVDGQVLALVASPEGPVHVWRLLSDRLIGAPQAGHHKPVLEIASAESATSNRRGGYLISRSEDGSVRRADVRPSGKWRNAVVAHVGGVSAVSAVATAEGPVYVVAGARGLVRVLPSAGSAPAGRKVARHKNRVSQILPAGRTGQDLHFVSVAGRRVRLWSLGDDPQVDHRAETHWSTQLSEAVTASACTAEAVVCATKDGTLVLVDLARGDLVWEGVLFEGLDVVSLHISGEDVMALLSDGSVWVLDHVFTKGRVPVQVRELIAPATGVTCATVLHERQRAVAVTGHRNCTVRAVDLKTGRPVAGDLQLPDIPRAISGFGNGVAVGCGLDVLVVECLFIGEN